MNDAQRSKVIGLLSPYIDAGAENPEAEVPDDGDPSWAERSDRSTDELMTEVLDIERRAS